MARIRKSPVAVDVKAIGGKALQRKLNKLKANAGKKVVNNAVRDATRTILKPAVTQNLRTVSPGKFGTGRLKSLGGKVVRKKAVRGGGQFGWEVRTPTREKLKIKPDHAYYPAILEFGDSARGMEPQRMLRKARERTQKGINAFMNRHIRQGINQMVRKLGRSKALR